MKCSAVIAFIICLGLGQVPAQADNTVSTASTIPRPDEAAVVFQPMPDIQIELDDGRKAAFSTLWKERPLLLTLVFSRCYGVCSPFLKTIRSVADDVGGTAKEYDFLVLSFDSRDTTDEMKIMAETTGAGGRAGWHFGIASEADIARLTQAIGFQFQWNETAQQYDHPATLVAVSEKGKVVRVVTGGALSRARFSEVVSELRGDFVPIYPTDADVLFRCFEFSADGVARPSWGLLILVYPAAITLLLTVTIFCLVRLRKTPLPRANQVRKSSP
ncbi:MAG: SCO family protein [Prosthecobacter sp.]|nr:SCO family protein [Prosthecobacter sp.]